MSRQAALRFLVRVIILAAVASSAAEAEVRCGNQLIEKGESALKVLKYCGQPAFGNPHFLEFGEWTYNFGPEQFMARVIIRNGKVARTETLGRGFVPPGGAPSEAPRSSPRFDAH